MTTGALPVLAARQLEALEQAGRLLEDLVTEPVEAALFVKRAEAIRYLVQASRMAEEDQDRAAVVCIKAKHRAGELFAELHRAPGGRPSKTPDLEPGVSEYRRALDEAGVDDRVVRHWQVMARIPEHEVDAFVAEVRTEGTGRLTTGAVLGWARWRQRHVPIRPDLELPEADWTDGRTSLLLGDCRDRLEALEPGSVDVIVTDPPYSEDALPLYSDLSKLAARLLGPRGVLFAWSGKVFLPDVVARLGEHLTYGWQFTLRLPGPNVRVRGRHMFEASKPVWAFFAGRAWPSGEWGSDLLVSPSRDKGLHEWQQHAAPARQLIERYCPDDGLVVDPFMGAGSFAIAAAQAGVRFVGCELDPETFAAARDRVATWTSVPSSHGPPDARQPGHESPAVTTPRRQEGR